MRSAKPEIPSRSLSTIPESLKLNVWSKSLTSRYSLALVSLDCIEPPTALDDLAARKLPRGKESCYIRIEAARATKAPRLRPGHWPRRREPRGSQRHTQSIGPLPQPA